MCGPSVKPVSTKEGLDEDTPRERRCAPVKACEHLNFLRAELTLLLLFVSEGILGEKLTRPAGTDLRAGTLNAFVNTITLDTEDLELCVSAADEVRIVVFSFGTRKRNATSFFAGLRTGVTRCAGCLRY